MKKLLFIGLLIILFGASTLYIYGRPMWVPVYQKIVGKRTISDVVAQYGEESKSRLIPYFNEAGIQYPPRRITLLAIKSEKTLELWAEDNTHKKLIKSYPIKAASGILGPKLREGDKQVPEGIYTLEYLNPNSAYHLSMKLNYPNEFDLKHAKLEGRNEPGTNIFIHGKALSIGCLAMGDVAIEELFILVADIGKTNVEVAIAPDDPRKVDIMPYAKDEKAWVNTLYADLTDYFKNYRLDSK
ncbi:hypothetical protein DS2_14904 [Catenovulum agarivorans DS-2]|uniref:L,D-TPase catalytic domain-containing protein n=1 Tax=Catenovulum agarivorans DS-2 TaxID=1328313 RepID=W7QLH6_9ALTE|nr:L,D-transpeptidase family protein [Catenovulum agarivorans]EWH08983.1 hypothetical protein DS2_14904 [Catenovulum agarivorans DS-2]